MNESAYKHMRTTRARPRWAGLLRVWLALGLGAVLALGLHSPALAGPAGGEVKEGQILIGGDGTEDVLVNQYSAKGIIDWQSFSLATGERIRFKAPSQSAVTLNRVTGGDPSEIFGRIDADGTIFLINRNGILFGAGSVINVGGLLATTANITNADFMAGNYDFAIPGTLGAAVRNNGSINIRDGGLAAFIAPTVSNDGLIVARLGAVALAGANKFTLDFYGDGLLSFALDEETAAALTGAEGEGVYVNGLIEAAGGLVVLSADVAGGIVSDIITVGGAIRASGVTTQGGRIILNGGNAGVRVTADATLDASGPLGGEIEVEAGRAILDGQLIANGTAQGLRGGEITVDANWVSLGGVLDVSGADGGNIYVNAGGLSNAGLSLAHGLADRGGNIVFDVATTVLEFPMALIDASGVIDGGSIRMTAGHQITTSGAYLADGLLGSGGSIDLSAYVVKSLSARFGARGGLNGGRIRIGGEYQGGKSLDPGADELENAQYTIISDGSIIDVSGGAQGGEVILWSDQLTIFQGLVRGDGAFVEISSAGKLEFAGDVEIGDGELLLDPKNIIIVADIFATQALSLVLGFNYSGGTVQQPPIVSPDSDDRFGTSVAIDGAHLAVGAEFDDGSGNAVSNAGAVYLFTFSGNDLTKPVLSAIIGAGYTGGNNIDNTALDIADQFGASVALDGTLLAVGAEFDDGSGNGVVDAGAIYLYSFTGDFTAITLEAIIGADYTVGNNIDNTALDAGDRFGTSVALDGTLLAVGADFDDGSGNGVADPGAVYLYSFTGDFTAITLLAIIGADYTGGNNIDETGLEGGDRFGGSVSLSGTLLAIGSFKDDGSGNGVNNSGAVYLYSFTGDFTAITLQAIIGADYAGGNNVDNTGLEGGDRFGVSVALDGTLLAVGASLDDGSGNSVSAAGAVYLYSYTGDFTAITLQAVIGADYTVGNNIDNTALDIGDQFGASVALDGTLLAVGAGLDDGSGNLVANAGTVYLYSFTGDFTAITQPTQPNRFGAGVELGGSDLFGRAVALDGSHLAVGALQDDGGGNGVADAGAVYLFTFTGPGLTGPVLSAVIGADYFGGNNVDNGALESGDLFGNSVSLDGTLLAVGAGLDDGSGNGVGDSGAVYLYSFTGDFTAITLQAIIGAGYVGGNNVDNGALEASDQFGASVALDGTLLAVGALQDDGSGNGVADAGAVYLYSFSGDFTAITLQAVIGADYAGGNNIDIPALEASDFFGISVAFDSNRLAVGASLDDGSGNLVADSGAVYLYSFTGDFTAITLEAVVGAGYTGGKNVDNTALEASDNFGTSVALGGNRLAVGAPQDDGSGNGVTDSGAVYFYSFSGDFTSITLQATIGAGYGAANKDNIDNGALEANDHFGISVALDGSNLAVGAENDDGDGNSLTDAGAVYFYSTGPAATSPLSLALGFNYSGSPTALDSGLDSNDRFGSSVALDGAHLAVGAFRDDGSGNGVSDAGAVYLFTFIGGGLTQPVLSAVIGAGYTGGNNVDNTALDASDRFGTSVALDGSHLAVGAPQDDGGGNGFTDAGAIYFYSFSGDFTATTLQAIIGAGYTGGNNVDNTALEDGDNFGRSVALDGSRLAVGAFSDQGSGNGVADAGAVYLYSFSGDFTAITLQAVIGAGYAGGNNVDETGLESNDRFSRSVSLSGTLLAVGAFGDDGSGNLVADSGAVYLYSFTGDFTAITLEAIIGAGYTVGNNVDNTALEAVDRFSISVALDGSRLAVGAFGDDGSGNLVADSGAVYLYSFTGDFTSINLGAVIGAGYTGGNNIDNPALETGDQFGSSVALDGTHLAIGAEQDDGSGNGLARAGAVYLYDNVFAAGVSFWTFADETGATSTFLVSQIAVLLNAGTNLTLQASNDITLDGALTVDNGSGDGGALTLQAGRSILLNASIVTDNGALTLVANETAANGVVDADRDAGAAVITMAAGTSIDTGSGAFKATLSTGAGNTNLTSGDISLQDITAGTIIVQNLGPSNGDVVLNDILTASGTIANATSIVLASLGGNFINNVGAGALVPGAGQRYLVYSQNPANDTLGGLTGTPWYNRVFDSGDPTNISGTGNRLVYSQTANLTVTAEDRARIYGDANPVFLANITGYVNGETIAVVFLGTPSLTTTATPTSDVGGYTITAALGTLATDRNYTFAFVDGTLTVNPATLTVTADDAARIYGDANPVFAAVITGFVNADTEAVVSNLSLTTTATPTSDVGAYAITGSSATATNYDFVFVEGTLTVNKATLTATADNGSRTYGDANPAFTATFTGFKNADTEAVVSNLLATTTATLTSDVGTFVITGVSATATNYDFVFVDGTLTVNKATLTVTADNGSRTYGDANPTFTASFTGFKFSDTIAVVSNLSLTTTATATSDVGAYAITGSGATATNYVFVYVDGTLTINPATLTVTADDDSRTYGDANPTFTASFTGFKFSDTIAVVSNLSLTTTATATSDVGAYAITGSGATATNYVFVYVDGTLTVNKATLTVTADDASRIAGAPNPTFTATITGFKNADTAGVISGLVLTTTATIESVPGDYPIAGSSATAINYGFIYVDGTLTVLPGLQIDQIAATINQVFTSADDDLAATSGTSSVAIVSTTQSDPATTIIPGTPVINSINSANQNLACLLGAPGYGSGVCSADGDPQ